jgi:formimidoylglutamase
LNLPDEISELLLEPAAMAPAVRDEYEHPASELIRPADEVEGAPLATMVGIPFDTSILGRRGAKSGPDAVRWGLNASLLYDPNIDVDLAEAAQVADVGDVDVLHTQVEPTWERVSAVTEALTRTGHPLLVLGGDHGLTFPSLRGFCRAVEGPVGLISIDAHLDVRISHHGEKSSGVPFRYALEELDQVQGANFTEFGISGWLNTRSYADYLREQDARVITGREIWRGDFDALLDETLERAADGTSAMYLTFDIDAIDGSIVDATNVPAVAGLSALQAQEIVWRFAQHPKAMGMDIMEVSPGWSSTTLSERMAASLALHYFAGRHVASQASG